MYDYIAYVLSENKGRTVAPIDKGEKKILQGWRKYYDEQIFQNINLTIHNCKTS